MSSDKMGSISVKFDPTWINQEAILHTEPFRWMVPSILDRASPRRNEKLNFKQKGNPQDIGRKHKYWPDNPPNKRWEEMGKK